MEKFLAHRWKGHHMHSAPTSRVAWRLGGAVSATLALGLAASPAAHAHDTLVESAPESDEVLEESPDEVVLEFSGDGITTGAAITNDIVVLDSDQEDWASEEPAEVEGSTMRTEIPEPLPNGEYEVRYRVVYSDGHDEEQGFTFEVEAPLEEGADEATLGDPDDAEAAEEPTEPSDESPKTAEPPPTEETDEDAALSQSQAQGGDERWGQGLFWAGLVAALAAIVTVVWFALRRRSTVSEPGGGSERGGE